MDVVTEQCKEKNELFFVLVPSLASVPVHFEADSCAFSHTILTTFVRFSFIMIKPQYCSCTFSEVTQSKLTI